MRAGGRAEPVEPSEVVDVAFRTRGRTLPVDHAHALSSAIHAVLEWFGEEDQAGVHPLHVAESAHGWIRPDAAAGQVLQLSRRTRLRLRLPARRAEAALRLQGLVLDVAGHGLAIGPGAVRRLRPHPTLFARRVAADDEEGEFLERAAAELGGLGIRSARLLCGKVHAFTTPSGSLCTRSLLVADLEPAASLSLQFCGLGPGRKLGCGLFVPYKSLEAAFSTPLA